MNFKKTAYSKHVKIWRSLKARESDAKRFSFTFWDALLTFVNRGSIIPSALSIKLGPTQHLPARISKTNSDSYSSLSVSLSLSLSLCVSHGRQSYHFRQPVRSISIHGPRTARARRPHHHLRRTAHPGAR
jgi:hypothetical protein